MKDNKISFTFIWGSLFYIVVFSVPFILISCSSSQLPKPSYQYISLTGNKYDETDFKEITYIDNRENLRAKYVEIGIIKFSGEQIDITILKKKAAEKGANVILKEGNNFILIRYKQKEKQKNEQKSFTFHFSIYAVLYC